MKCNSSWRNRTIYYWRHWNTDLYLWMFGQGNNVFYNSANRSLCTALTNKNWMPSLDWPQKKNPHHQFSRYVGVNEQVLRWYRRQKDWLEVLVLLTIDGFLNALLSKDNWQLHEETQWLVPSEVGAQEVGFEKKCDRVSIKYLAREKDNLSSEKYGKTRHTQVSGTCRCTSGFFFLYMISCYLEGLILPLGP